jgi:hypothetical protein
MSATTQPVHDVPGTTHGLADADELPDVGILDCGIMHVPASDILGTSALATYIGGRAVYERSR